MKRESKSIRAEQIYMVKQFKKGEDKAGRYLDMYATCWQPETGVEIYLGAPTKKKLTAVWDRLEKTPINVSLIYKVRVYKDG